MSLTTAGNVVALVAHGRQVPAEDRGRFAVRLRDELPSEALVVETCHRVEAYVISTDDGERLAASAPIPPGGRMLVGEAAVRHAIAVAAGCDSVVVGEDQILHQLRESVDAARANGGLDTTLERLFALALRAGRRARSWHRGPRTSLADVALRSIERQRGPLGGLDILVVGAGRMGRLAVRAAVAAGASVAVANRSADGARQLAAMTGARLEVYDPGERTGTFDGIVVALAGQWPIGSSTIDALAASATTVVDLSVPAAVPAEAGPILGPRFVSADALALFTADSEGPQGPSPARLERLVDDTTAQFLDWLKARDGRAAAEVLIERADREREAELAALWRRLPDLPPEARDAIEGMTRHLARRILREPLERLGRDSSGRDERSVRDLFAL